MDDILYQTAAAWDALCGRQLRITYGRSGMLHEIPVSFHKGDFAHLAGFQYLDDISNIPDYWDTVILDKILAGKITNDMIRSGSRY